MSKEMPAWKEMAREKFLELYWKKKGSACVTFQLSTDCRPLDDEAFFGTFYGYCRNTQPDHCVEKFVLKISQEEKNDARAGGVMATDKNVKAFFDQCKDLRYSKEEYYSFSEKVLLAMGEAHGIDYDTTAATIMTLKEYSINPKVVDFPNNKTYSKFFAGLTLSEK